MKPGRGLAQVFLPWAGLVIGLPALAIVHQVGSEGTFNDCRAASPGPILAVALVGLLVCLAAGLGSWRSIGRSNRPSRRLIGTISVGSAGLFAFAILLAMIAALVLPPCFQ